MIRVLVLLALLAPALPAAAAVTEIHYVMGTYLQITVDAADSDALRTTMRRCFSTARDLDARFSRFQPDSELSRLNAGPMDDTVAVSGEMAALLQAAIDLREQTGETFDVGAGAVTRLWRTAMAWPDAATLTAARQTSGAQSLRLVGTELRRHPGVQIDVDGLAKGWAVDRCVTQLRVDRVDRALVSFGESSIYALGAPAGERGWPVTVRSLDDERATGVLMLRDAALSVSAVFGHERSIGARRVGHIVDPRTGLPLTTPRVAAVVAHSATAAEAFSKALLIDARSANRAVAGGIIRGALLLSPARTRRYGDVPFTEFARAQPIASAAEPLR